MRVWETGLCHLVLAALLAWGRVAGGLCGRNGPGCAGQCSGKQGSVVQVLWGMAERTGAV